MFFVQHGSMYFLVLSVCCIEDHELSTVQCPILVPGTGP